MHNAQRIRAGILWALALWFCTGLALAAPIFPALTGHVVDEAHVLSLAARDKLEQQLSAHEEATSNQVVVVTIPTLNGEPIESYGYQLGRYWKLGQQAKNNGVLLLYAQKEKQIRIDVGYGLESTLTDAVGSTILQRVMLPFMREGRYEDGLVNGVAAILATLGDGEKTLLMQHSQASLPGWVILVIVVGFLWLSARHPMMAYYLLSSLAQRSGSSRMDSNRWRGGGGGSFGGGGATGGW